VWWNVYIALHSKFPAESVSEIIFKIGSDLTKVTAQSLVASFFWDSVFCSVNLLFFSRGRSLVGDDDLV